MDPTTKQLIKDVYLSHTKYNLFELYFRAGF
jgi:hypothetical protein